jgi:hypothetical protein
MRRIIRPGSGRLAYPKDWIEEARLVVPLSNQFPSREARLKRLAGNLDALAGKDEKLFRRTREIMQLRRTAAVALHRVCAAFVDSLNRLLATSQISLDPAEFAESAFQEDGPNLIQIGVRGRILQAAFEATPELVSTEDFRIPYTLAGSVRAFNQELLDKDLIEEQLLFYTLENGGSLWRFFDARTYRSGPFDQDYLVALMEQLV